MHSNEKMAIRAPLLLNAVEEYGQDWDQVSQATEASRGGPPPQSSGNHDPIIEKVKTIIGPSLEGLFTIYDGDAEFMKEQQESASINTEMQPIDVIVVDSPQKMEKDYFIDDLRVLDEIDEVESHTVLVRRVKMYKIRKNPLEELQENEFKSKYRFSRSTAVFIIDMIKNDLAGNARGGFIPPYLKVLAAIRIWARGEIQDDAGDLSGMSQSTISLVCKQVALAILAQRSQWIKMPQTDAEQNKVIVDFHTLCAFRQVIGAIDCTHIRIPKVGREVGQYYIHRKGYSSINVQVVSNANLEIMDIVAHWRGSTHDARIFNESRLKQRFEQSEFKGRLLGDSGYACTPYLYSIFVYSCSSSYYNKRRTL
ncbi:hypothetical protein HW555_005077 [Spodoptera exigua]|uniref:DDE Tnp4 domain-containing protein n=1 Tax=Spodoptera exigua TaxID=7107 RepID=A0A835L6V7_SPOEX|nr:hypothetical protein HW555_005077 [Spodoptera exigua]